MAGARRWFAGGHVAWVPLSAGLLMLGTIHAAWLVSAYYGHIAWCNPYLDRCTSISATGRQLPARLFFKPLVMMAALAAAASWLLVARWLRWHGDGARVVRQVLAWSGAFAAFCLVAYTAALGEAGDTARALRRVGVSLGFGCTFLCQVLLLSRLHGLRHRMTALRGVYPAMFFLVFVLFVAGFASIFLAAFHADYHQMDDAFEWWFALLLNLQFPLLALLWWRQGWRLVPQEDAGVE